MVTRERDGPAAEHLLDEFDRLLEPVRPHCRCIEAHAHLVVLFLEPPRADTELDPSARQHVRGGYLLREQGRVPEVVAVYVATDAQCRGRGGRGDNKRRTGHGIRVMVRDEQGVEAGGLHTAGETWLPGDSAGAAKLVAAFVEKSRHEVNCGPKWP